MAHIIVLGNEKGGSGKSTTAMHVTTALLRRGARVGALDLDLRQQSFFTYLEHRDAFVAREGIALPCPSRIALNLSQADSLAAAQAEEEAAFAQALTTLEARTDYIVIDCPGSHTRFSQMAHSTADTLITPMNDSLVDLSLLAKLDPASGRVSGPSVYAEMVWNARQLRAAAGLPPLDWVVLRNRLSATEAHNKRRVGKALAELSKRIGFRLVPGFTERVIFRDLYLQGLTLLDLDDTGINRLTLSNVAARHELRALMKALNLEQEAAA